MMIYGLSLIEQQDRYAIIAPAPLDSYFVVGASEILVSPEVLGWIELIPGWTKEQLVRTIEEMVPGLEQQRRKVM